MVEATSREFATNRVEPATTGSTAVVIADTDAVPNGLEVFDLDGQNIQQAGLADTHGVGIVIGNRCVIDAVHIDGNGRRITG